MKQTNKGQHQNTDRRVTVSLYEAIVETYLETGTVRETANKLGTTDVTVRKVLITEDLWSSRTSREVRRWLDSGKTTAEISQILSTTEKAVQQYLPYTKGMYHCAVSSVAARNSAEYRRRIRNAQERTLRRAENTLMLKGWENMTLSENVELFQAAPEQETPARHGDQYPGALCLRDLPDLDLAHFKCCGEDILRLHLELFRPDWDGAADGDLAEFLKQEQVETTRVLRAYGGVSGKTISRDIAVPGSLSLYALHYVIQRLFGWQNSHLHHFSLPAERFEAVTCGKAGKWSDLVGVLFQSPDLSDEDRFWNDDYLDGSFKVWLRKKYCGPYVSLNHGEGIVQSRLDMARIGVDAPYVDLMFAQRPDGEEILFSAIPTQRRPTAKRNASARDGVRRERVAFEDAPVDAMRLLFDTDPNQLLERLSIDQILAFRNRSLEDGLAPGEEIAETFEDVLDEELREDIREILQSCLDEPEVQPVVAPVTDTLYYFYDYGDGWIVKITGSYGCADLVDAGKLTQETIDDAIRTVYRKFRPVCLFADGLPLLDDVGGMDGYVRFLRGINRNAELAHWRRVAAETGARVSDLIPENWDYDDPDTLEWAKGLGWSKRKSRPENML